VVGVNGNADFGWVPNPKIPCQGVSDVSTEGDSRTDDEGHVRVS